MTQQTMAGLARWGAVFGIGAVAVATACDPFSVTDPQRYTDKALDSALDAVANGAEGQFHLTVANYIIDQALLGDEWQHTGTWAGYDDMDKGRTRYGISPYGDPNFNALLRARYATEDAQARFTRLGIANTDPRVVQVTSTEAWVDLYLGEGFCEATQGQGTAAIPDVQMFQQAIGKLRNALSLAQQASLTDWINYDRAGLARAHLLAAAYDSAAANAALVPDNWIKYAQYSASSLSQYNTIVFLDTYGFNKAGGLRQRWWSQVDTINSKLIDPWTGQLDSRVEIKHPPGELGVDGKTPFYSQWKYKTLGAGIPLTKSEEMRLIEAEAAWRKNDTTTALAKMNAVRAKFGLNRLPPAGSVAKVGQYLLAERFATLFLEGRRLADLNRFNLIATGGLGVLPLGTGRLMKFPLSQFEAQNSPGGVIPDDLSKRCQPIS
jgi:hypothetical protein